MERTRWKEKIGQSWKAFTLKKKILTFTGVVFLIISLSVLFSVWVVKFALLDFNRILEDNAKCSAFIQAMEKESRLCEEYWQSPEKEEWKQLQIAITETKQAVNELPFDYGKDGAKRYSKTWSILNCYEVYEERRKQVLSMSESDPDYINKLYELYDIQTYLNQYARILMTYTLETGNAAYQKKVGFLILMPGAVIIVGVILLGIMISLAKMMNETMIHPIMELVRGAKRITENDFYIEDIQVENQDELGELVAVFNKMKYATGEYIQALEEKRLTLELLHEEKLEKLETEKRLETIKLELLKSQINPHFLFNTLNIISGMAKLEEAETTEQMTKALSSLFRYNLRMQDAEVLLGQELKVVKDYMYLQQMRFGKRISYEINCEVDEERVMVPSFTFQPLIENAILHGLARKEAGGKIRIRIRKKDRLYIWIGDNGAGMSEKGLENLRKNLEKSDGRQRGIGLGNIYKRIQSMYPDGSMVVYSKENVGTVVKIVIPLISWG